MIWAGRKADDAPAVAAARQSALAEAEDEYRRLLYVAMTRAADRLIVCGAEGERQAAGLVAGTISFATPLEPLLVEDSDGENKIWRYRKTASWPRVRGNGAPPKPKRENFRPGCGGRSPAKRSAPGHLSPSSAFAEEIGRTATFGTSAAERQKALERGRIVHRLMQSLPDIPSSRRMDAAAHYLAGAAKDFSSAEQAEIVRQISAILDAPEFAELFAPGSRAEVPIVGRVARMDGDTERVPGQVDRLVVTDNAVLIGDYKTDGLVPRSLDEVPPAYVAQLALYRAVLARLYPGKAVRTALIFTAVPVLIEIPARLWMRNFAKS